MLWKGKLPSSKILEIKKSNNYMHGTFCKKVKNYYFAYFSFRVKVSVARKDELLNELQTEHKALQEKCHYLENMLEQQRKEYLIK